MRVANLVTHFFGGLPLSDRDQPYTIQTLVNSSRDKSGRVTHERLVDMSHFYESLHRQRFVDF